MHGNRFNEVCISTILLAHDIETCKVRYAYIDVVKYAWNIDNDENRALGEINKAQLTSCHGFLLRGSILW